MATGLTIKDVTELVISEASSQAALVGVKKVEKDADRRSPFDLGRPFQLENLRAIHDSIDVTCIVVTSDGWHDNGD